MQAAEKLPTSDPRPSPRRSSAGGIFNGCFYILGGVDSRGNHYSDFWRLDLDDSTWTLLSEEVLPQIRLPGISCVDNVHYVFGGRGGDKIFFNHIWRYDDKEFSRLKISDKVPEPRYGHAQTVSDKNIYVFGGLRKQNHGHDLFGDLWKFDPDQHRWTLLSRGGPSPRYGAALVGWEDKLVLFGGRYLEQEWWFSDETWVFDLTDREWSRVTPKRSPNTRYTPGVAATKKAMYIYGGMESRYEPIDTSAVRHLNRFLTSLPIRNRVFPTLKPNIFFSDLWKFDRFEHSWERISRNLGIPPLKTPLMGINDSSLIIGFGNNLQTHYRDIWKYPEFI